MRLFTVFSAIATTVALSSSVNAYTATNGLSVVPVSGQGAYEVTTRGGDGARALWCAAAQYAREVHGLSSTQRVYLETGYGKSQTKPGLRGVSFTTRPTAALASGPRLGDAGNYSVSIRRAGFSLTVGHAENFCDDVFDKEADWPL